jgi:hypothetical protein
MSPPTPSESPFHRQQHLITKKEYGLAIKTFDPLSSGKQTAHRLLRDSCPSGQSRYCCTLVLRGSSVRISSQLSNLPRILTGLKSAEDEMPGYEARKAYFECGGS